MTTAINHGNNNDQNIIVQATYDKGGRMTTLRNPNGHLTQYEHDQLNRRVKLTDPMAKVWTTAHSNLSTGGTRLTVTEPNTTTQRDFDPLGRTTAMTYSGSLNVSPNVSMVYDLLGNRTRMTETVSSSTVRETHYAYDDTHRLTDVDYDKDGDGNQDETVSYVYDAGGLRTQMIIKDEMGTPQMTVSYTYNERGQLTGMSWDGQQTDFEYDNAGRHTITDRNTGQLTSKYTHDGNGRLRHLRHETASAVMAEFAYAVDKRGNRTLAEETVRIGEAETILDTDPRVTYEGIWSSNQTDDPDAVVNILFADINPVLTMGEGPKYSMYDIYINGAYYQTYDGYAASISARQITISLDNHGPHEIEIRNRPQHSHDARNDGGFEPDKYTLRFEQLAVSGDYDVRTMQYVYDGIGRLLQARHNPGLKRNLADGALLRRYLYEYDNAGNRTRELEAVDGAVTSDTTYTYNDKNQLINDGIGSYNYDDNGNLTSGAGTTYGWDQANRMTFQQSISHVWETYEYDGSGNRVRRTNNVVLPPPDPQSSTITDYLMDTQASLPNVISATTNGVNTRYIHGPRGIQAQKDSAGSWTWLLQDGLGSVRGSSDNAPSPQSTTYHMYDPYGSRYAGNGSDFGFTGEQNVPNGLLYLRARHYAPGLGVFTALDPFEGMMQRPMSLNGYSWVEGNPVNRTDPTGLFDWCTGRIEEGDTLGQIYYAAAYGNSPLDLPQVMRWLGEQNIGHPIYTQGVGDYNIIPNSGHRLDPSWPPLSIDPRILAAAQLNLGFMCPIQKEPAIAVPVAPTSHGGALVEVLFNQVCDLGSELIRRFTNMFGCSLPTNGSNAEKGIEIIITELQRFFPGEYDSRTIRDLLYDYNVTRRLGCQNITSFATTISTGSDLMLCSPVIANEIPELMNLIDYNGIREEFGFYCLPGTPGCDNIHSFAIANFVVKNDQSFINSQMGAPTCEFQRSVRLAFAETASRYNAAKRKLANLAENNPDLQIP